MFLLVRLPWLFVTSSATGFFSLGHGATAMPSLGGPAWAMRWLRWDSGWYVKIIQEGFSASHCGEPGGVCLQASISFLPAYPMSVRGLMQLGLSLPLASFLLNAVCLVLMLWGLRRLAALTLGEDAATRTSWVLLAFPTTLFFSAGYAEALFGAASVWAMVFATQQRAVPAALAFTAGALCRPHGIVLVACVVFVALLRKRIRLSAIITLITGAAFAAYLFWQHQAFSDALAFVHARRAWASPYSALATFTSYVSRAANQSAFTVWQDVFGALTLAAAAIWSWRRLGAEYALFCLLLLALPLSQGQLWGMSRATLGAFPVFLMLASAGERYRLPLLFFGLSLATVDAMLFINGHFVA